MSLSSERELLRRGKALQNLGREERLQWEEAVRNTIATYQHRRPQEFSHRLWAMLLVSLTGSLDAISTAELRALDITTTFPTREVTWNDQPMVAIRLPDQREEGWILMPPAIWEKITRQLQGVREPRQQQERTPRAASQVRLGYPGWSGFWSCLRSYSSVPGATLSGRRRMLLLIDS